MPATPQDLDRVSHLLAEVMIKMSDRGLGDVQLRSNLAQSAQSDTTARAADNLLAKARRDLAAGRPERAASYLDRALRLPYSEMAEAPTALHGAHMILFSAVADALEAGDEGDSAWLNAAEATIPQCGDTAREDLLQTLRALDHDYRLAPSQRRRIRALAPGTSPGGDVILDRAGVDEATQRSLIIELLLATTVYEAEFDRHLRTA